MPLACFLLFTMHRASYQSTSCDQRITGWALAGLLLRMGKRQLLEVGASFIFGILR